MSTLLHTHNLCAGYGRVQILYDLELHLDEGECVTVIGPNGAGKSTLLRAIAGVKSCTSGSVTFRGQDISRAGAEELVEKGLSLVPEGRELFSSMSVEDNLMLGAYTRYRRKDPRVGAALEKVYTIFPRLAERKKQLAGTMSGGEQQMLAVGRALVLEPTLLILDEPSLGLAPLIVQEIMNVIRRLKAEGVSILLVEQNARAALSVADRAYVLEGGRVAMQGRAEDLRKDERVTQAYLGAAR